MSLTGECFCGSIKYRIDGPLTQARSCHCSRCRKAFSAAASAYAEVNASDFTWTQGDDLLSSYSSQPGFGLVFCSRCGSTLCGTWKERIHGITLGCLNDDPGIEIGCHIYTDSRASWDRLPDGVLCYPEGPAD